MTGTIFDIKKFAVHDGPGIRTTVFFKGCPLRCSWCHNPESINPAIVDVPKAQKVGNSSFVQMETVGKEMTADELMHEILSDRIFMEESGGGVTFSGGEPFLQYGFLLEMVNRCRSEGVHTVVDTSAFTETENLMKIAVLTDLLLVDLKVMDDVLHKKYTGVSNERILYNIQVISENKIPFRIRIPVIPGVSFTDSNIMAAIDFLATLPEKPVGIDLLPFHNTGNHKYERFGLKNVFRDVPSLQSTDLEELKNPFNEAGFDVHVGG